MAIEVINGARRNFGPREVEDKVPGEIRTAGEVKQVVVDFNYDDLPTNSTNDALVRSIPAFSAFVSAHLIVKTTFAGGTSIEVGTVQSDGTAVDVDGLVTPAQGAVANLVAGNVILGRGAQIVGGFNAGGTDANDADGVYTSGATAAIPSVATQLKVTAVGTFTAGAAKLVVSYIERN